MQFERYALDLFVGQVFAVAFVCAVPSKFCQIVGFEFDAVKFVVATEFFDFFLGGFLAEHNFAFFVACKFVEEVLLGEFPAIFVFGAKCFGYRKFWHNRIGIDAVRFHFIDYLLRVCECFGQVAEYGGHLVGCFQPFLFGVVHAACFVHKRSCRYTDEVVVRIGVFFFDKVCIVGANNFCVGFSCQFDQYRIDFLLPHIYFLVAAGFVGFVSL